MRWEVKILGENVDGTLALLGNKLLGRGTMVIIPHLSSHLSLIQFP